MEGAHLPTTVLSSRFSVLSWFFVLSSSFFVKAKTEAARMRPMGARLEKERKSNAPPEEKTHICQQRADVGAPNETPQQKRRPVRAPLDGTLSEYIISNRGVISEVLVGTIFRVR